MKGTGTRVLWGIVGLAALLRVLRAVQRWDEIALAYVAYWQAFADAIARGEPLTALVTFSGLHPPGYALLWAWVDVLSGHRPLAWLLLSVFFSTAAVWMVGRLAGAAAAALLAMDPFQLAYCAEINNYPMLVFAVALCLVARQRCRREGIYWPLVAAGALAGWTHLLGGLFAGLCLFTLRTWRHRGLGLVALAVAVSPVLWVAWGLAGQEGTFGQSGQALASVWDGLWTKSGPWLLLLVPAAWASRRRLDLALVLFGTVAAIGALTVLGVAAPHQQPYWVVVGPPLAVVLGAYLPGVAWLGALSGLWGLPGEVERLGALQEGLSRERAVDQVLNVIQPGDALWLLAPALMPDDDKTMTSDVLWRLPPWKAAPAWRGPQGATAASPAFEFADYGYGQPRLIDGLVVHTSTDLWAEQLTQVLTWHRAAGRTLWFVLYDHGPADDYPGLLRRQLEETGAVLVAVGEDRGLGQDYLLMVTADDAR